MMKPGSRKSFRAVLEATGTRPRFVMARVPLDLKKTWPDWKNRRVRGAINGFAFRTTLFPFAKGTGHVLLVNKKMQAGARATAGDAVQIQIEPDLEPQFFAEPKELTNVLRGDRALRKWFDAMSPSMRKGFAQLVDGAKSLETRRVRAEKVAETVMLAMEGELEPPPILRAAFQRQPLARTGWDAMTPTQRRSHLLGIFFPGTVEAQARRAAKAVEECLRVARRKKGAI
jgi:uncharacterized protein YdeI (YjbR/CyaY-like superfamily)